MLLHEQPHRAYIAAARYAIHQPFTNPLSSRPIISYRVTLSKAPVAKMHVESASFTSNVVKAMRSLYGISLYGERKAVHSAHSRTGIPKNTPTAFGTTSASCLKTRARDPQECCSRTT